MVITKQGKSQKSKGEFSFSCKKCGCEWKAERSEVTFSPPCLPYAVHCKCPNCGVTAETGRRQTRMKEAWEYAWEEEQRRMRENNETF